MTINKTLDGTKLTVTLEGRLDTMTAPELDKNLSGELTGITELVFDFNGLVYLSSAGLRSILAFQKQMNKQSAKMIIRGANDSIMEVFTITGFVDILTIE